MTTNTKPFWWEKELENVDAEISPSRIKDFVSYVESQTLLNAQKTIRELKGKYGLNEQRVMDFNEIIEECANSLTPLI